MFTANVLKIMIASPGDVSEERRVVTEAIHRWNDANASARQLVLLPVKWETHSTPEMGGHPQDIINRQLLHDVDIVIGIFGTRIGTPTLEYISGTVEEIKRQVAAVKTAKIYFSDVPIAPSELNTTQYALVQQFREECRSTGLYSVFGSVQDFTREFGHHLDLELNQPRYRWLGAPSISVSLEKPLSKSALRLLKAAASTDDGLVLLQKTMSGEGLSIGEEEFMDGTPRSAALWRSVLSELQSEGKLERLSEGQYRVTSEGYSTVDLEDDPALQKSSAFDESRTTRVREAVTELDHRQRDLLRFLLLQGGSARSTVIHNAWSHSSIGFDWGGMTKPLADKGLIQLVQNLSEGYSTAYVNESMAESLKAVLFPRNEESGKSFFAGI